MTDGTDSQLLADEFAMAVRLGRRPRPAPGGAKRQLMVLRHLIRLHPLETCRIYAAADVIPWGRFAALDILRLLVLNAPVTPDPAMPDLPDMARGTSYILCPRPGADKVLFVFTGAARQFGGPLQLMHRWLASLGVSIIYLIDTDWSFYLGPLPGLGVSLEDKSAALLDLMRQLGGRACFCMGNSGGGFGALLLAPRLGASRTLAYSPPTVIRESLDRVQAVLPELGGLLAPDGTISLADQFARIGRVPRARIYYPEANAHDSAEAAHLDGIAGLTVRGIGGVAEHNLIPFVVSRRLLPVHLDWLVGR